MRVSDDDYFRMCFVQPTILRKKAFTAFFLRCYTERGEEVVPVGIVDECMGTFTAAFLFFSAVRVPIHFAVSEK